MTKSVFACAYPVRNSAGRQTIREHYPIHKERPGADLYRQAERKAFLLAVLALVLGGLLLGPGMALLMVLTGESVALGIFLGLFGLTLVCAAMPLYRRTLEQEEDRIAAELRRKTA